MAFSAEEAGLLGSRYYVEHPRPAPLEGIVGVINLDSVGRLEDQPISVLATGSAMEWPFVFRGVTAVTGIPSKSIAGAAGSSDQQSFIDRGVPGVQIFTGAHLDYHRASDTPGQGQRRRHGQSRDIRQGSDPLPDSARGTHGPFGQHGSRGLRRFR